MDLDKASKYIELVSQILKGDILDEKNRLLFYDLHMNSHDPNNEAVSFLFSKILRHKKYNEHFILNEVERRKIFVVIENLRQAIGLNRYEYRYLTFLISKYRLTPTVSLPCLPKIIDFTVSEFEQRFSFNEKRKIIFDIFKNGIQRCHELYKLEEVEVLVGGSFTNLENQLPNDIDPLILLPKKQWDLDRKHLLLDEIIIEFKQPNGKNDFDLHKMLMGISNEHYMSYELMTLMGNTPNSKAETGILDMNYKCKDLIRLKLKRQVF
jgi:hypothetical protein